MLALSMKKHISLRVETGGALFEKNFDYIVARMQMKARIDAAALPRNINLRENVCQLRPRNAGGISRVHAYVFVCACVCVYIS